MPVTLAQLGFSKESDFVKHLRDFLLRLPDEKFCYSSWAYESGDPECGTVACVGGWLPAMFPAVYRLAEYDEGDRTYRVLPDPDELELPSGRALRKALFRGYAFVEADRIEPYADRETVILHYNEIIEELEILESKAS